MSESWNLDRKPTTAERAVGIIAAALLCAAGAAASWFSVEVLRNSWAAIASGIFTVVFAFLLIRFAFAKAQKPSQSQILATTRIVIVLSLVMLVLSFFADELRARIALISLGLIGLVGGISNLARKKKESNQGPEPMPLKRHG